GARGETSAGGRPWAAAARTKRGGDVSPCATDLWRRGAERGRQLVCPIAADAGDESPARTDRHAVRPCGRGAAFHAADVVGGAAVASAARRVGDGSDHRGTC